VSDIDRIRMKVARRGLWIAWGFNVLFTAVALALALGAGERPLIFGLPRWMALSCVIAPGVFAAALIPLIEWAIPNIPLSDREGED